MTAISKAAFWLTTLYLTEHFIRSIVLMNLINYSHYNEFNHFQGDYNDSLTHSLIYNGMRCLQMIIGIIGNGMTLHILRKLKVLKNGHILMTYLAVSDIIVNCMVPLAAFISISRFFKFGVRYWKTICIIKEYFYLISCGFSICCYCMLSVDR